MNILQMLGEVNLFKDIVVPGLAALAAVWFATRKFQREHLWKDKYAAYQGVLRSLESISHWASETQSDVYSLPGVGTKGVAEEYTQAQRELSRQITVGRLLLPENFCTELEEFMRNFHAERYNAAEEWHDDPQSQDFAWGEHAGRVYKIVERHRAVLIRLARSDLGIKRAWPILRVVRRVFLKGGEL